MKLIQHIIKWQEYTYEPFRQRAFTSAVEEPFSPFCTMSSSRSKSDCTTCVSIDEKTYSLVNWEFKNEICNISSEPNQQNQAYFVHLKASDRGCSPLLLVTVVGCHHMQVFGAVWNGSHICVDPLSVQCPYCQCLVTPNMVLQRWPTFSLP